METKQLLFLVLSLIPLGIFLFLLWISFVLIVDDISLAFTIVVYGAFVFTPVGAACSSWYYTTPLPHNPGEVAPLNSHSNSVSSSDGDTAHPSLRVLPDKAKRRFLILISLMMVMFFYDLLSFYVLHRAVGITAFPDEPPPGANFRLVSVSLDVFKFCHVSEGTFTTVTGDSYPFDEDHLVIPMPLNLITVNKCNFRCGTRFWYPILACKSFQVQKFSNSTSSFDENQEDEHKSVWWLYTVCILVSLLTPLVIIINVHRNRAKSSSQKQIQRN